MANLVANALKFGPAKPIELEVTEHDGTAKLTVTDHGLGIRAEDLSRIFGRFERVVSVRNYGGFGLGLWIAREIVEAHAGAISVASKPGEGSTFTITMPEGGPEAIGRRVMVIDDDDMIRTLVADVLADEGFSVESVDLASLIRVTSSTAPRANAAR